MNFNTLRLGALALSLCAAGLAVADEAAIRKNLAERLPNFPKIDEVSKSPIAGLYEVRLGTDLLYTDENGSYIVQGSIIDTKTRTDITQARIDKLTAIDFASLPLKDAILIKQGAGTRKLVVFADPNCGYCKRIEKDLLTLKDVSIYTFLLPILGPDSNVKSRDIWCAKEPAKIWRSWMVDGTAIPKSMGECDTAALDRNLKMGQRYKVNGTPAVVFEDGSRSPGAMPAAQIEARMVAAKKG
ncbi:MAG: DsbC family protein [Ideonella sp.]|jgi:thiol:disulfide interchange protein DsbC|nr:DsbC family protein [Ideonella sp.]MBL0149674.1 DsbC family protein [Ideonella sp.]